MDYHASIVKKPAWSDDEIVRVKEMLTHKIAKMGDFDVDAVRRGITFREQHIYPGRTELIGDFESRADLYIDWMQSR